jgi:hypothetical protein
MFCIKAPLQVLEMSIRITLRLIIASIAFLLLTATIIAIRDFYLEVWDTWRLSNYSQSEIKSGTMTDNLQFSKYWEEWGSKTTRPTDR